MFLTTWLVAKFFILRQRFFPLKILSYVGSLVALGDLRFAPPLPTLPFIISRACLLVPPQPAVILLGNICYRGGETASYPARRSCWVKLLLRTQLVGARSNPYRKATETLRMKFSSNFEETGFEFCLEPWLGDWKNCVHLLFQSVGNTSPFLSHLLVTNIHAFYVYGAQARSSFALNTITHFEIILSLKSISLYSGTHYTQY